MGASYQKSWYPGFRSCVRGYSGELDLFGNQEKKEKDTLNQIW